MKIEITIDDLSRARAYIATVEWRFAKTMPQWPHFYTVYDREPNREAEFFYFAHLIHKHGEIDAWGKHRWIYLTVDGLKYWVLGDVINRADPKPNAVVLEEGEKYLAARKAEKS